MTVPPVASDDTSLNLTLSPNGDMSEYMFPTIADECDGMLSSLDEALKNEDIFNDMILLSPSDHGDVEFGEVFTDINSLINLASPSGIVYSEEITSSVAEVAVPTSDSVVVVPHTAELLSIAGSEFNNESFTTLCVAGQELDDELFTFAPDHCYTAIKQATTRKRNHSEISVGENSNCSGDVKLTKYLERRRKNNIASKRSRETRKSKFLTMDDQAKELEKSNQDLRQRIEQLESLTKRMKEALVAKLSAAN